MIQGVTFVPKWVAENMIPDAQVGIISIVDVGGEVYLREGWGSVLKMQFDDIERRWQNYYPMTAKQSEEIVDWLELHEDKLTGVVVHCEQGVSRSAGVAKFIAERYNLYFDKDYKLYNRLVYRLLANESLMRRATQEHSSGEFSPEVHC